MKEKDKAERALEGLLRRNLAGPPAAGNLGAAAGKDCAEAEILAAYFERSLPDAEAGRWELHFSKCARCQEQLAALARIETATAAAKGAAQTAPSPEGIWWRLRYWLAPAATAAAAVALWVAINPVPPVTETVALRTEQQVAVSPAPATKETLPKSRPAAGEADKSAEAPARSILSERAAAKPDSKYAREERDADTLGKLAKKNAEPTAAPMSAAAKPASPAAEGKKQGAIRRDLPVARTDELSKMKMETAAANEAAGAAEKRSRALADAHQREAVEVKAAEQEVAAAPAAPVAGVAAQSAAGGRAAGMGMTRASALSSQDREMLVASPGREIVWRLTPGVVERSSDKGKTWSVAWSEEGVALHAGAAPSEKVCWVVGDRGTVLRTTDGKQFEKVNAPAPAALVAIGARDALHATVSTVKGEKYVTADGGKTWRVE